MVPVARNYERFRRFRGNPISSGPPAGAYLYEYRGNKMEIKCLEFEMECGASSARGQRGMLVREFYSPRSGSSFILRGERKEHSEKFERKTDFLFCAAESLNFSGWKSLDGDPYSVRCRCFHIVFEIINY